MEEEHNRRVEDRLTAELAAMEKRIMEHVSDSFQDHVTTRHIGKSQQEIQDAWDTQVRMRAVLNDTNRMVNMLVDDYFGEQVTDIDGIEHREGGFRSVVDDMRDDVHEFRRASENGGVNAKVQLTTAQKVALWTVTVPVVGSALVGAFAIITALIERGSP